MYSANLSPKCNRVHDAKEVILVMKRLQGFNPRQLLQF